MHYTLFYIYIYILIFYILCSGLSKQPFELMGVWAAQGSWEHCRQRIDEHWAMSLADIEGNWLARSERGGFLELERMRNWRLITLVEEMECIDNYYLFILEAEQIQRDLWQFIDEEVDEIFCDWWYIDDIGEGREWGVD